MENTKHCTVSLQEATNKIFTLRYVMLLHSLVRYLHLVRWLEICMFLTAAVIIWFLTALLSSCIIVVVIHWP